jgi:hypothetical protein
MRRKFVVLLLLALLAIPAFADEMIWSPNHSKALIVDTSAGGILFRSNRARKTSDSSTEMVVAH